MTQLLALFSDDEYSERNEQAVSSVLTRLDAEEAEDLRLCTPTRFVPHYVYTLEEMYEAVTLLLGVDCAYIDTETTGLHRVKDKLVCITIAALVEDEWQAYFFPWYSKDEGWRVALIQNLNTLLEEESIRKLFFNAAFDTHHLIQAGFAKPRSVDDVRPMTWLWNEREKPRSLKQWSKKVLDWVMIEFKELAEFEKRARIREATRDYVQREHKETQSVQISKYLCPKCRRWKSERICKPCVITEQPEEQMWRTKIETKERIYKPEVPAILDIRDIRESVYAPYAMTDCTATGMLHQWVEPRLQQQWPNQWKFYERVERPLIEVVRTMESHGIAVNESFFQELHVKALAEHKRIEQFINNIVCIDDVKLSSPAQKSKLLYDTIGYPDEGGERATDRFAMKDIMRQAHPEQFEMKQQFEKALKENKHDAAACERLTEDYYAASCLPEMLMIWSDYHKLVTSFLEPMPKFIHNGRLYTTFDPCGTRTGRFSASSPNLQQSTHKFGFRSGFVAPEGRLLIVADFKQMELVMAAHFSQDSEMLRALLSGEDLHRKTIGHILQKSVDEVTDKERKMGKYLNFGLIFRQSLNGFGYMLAHNDVLLDKPTLEKYYNGFFKLYKGIKPWHNSQIKFVQTNGYAETLTKRRRLLSEARDASTKMQEWAYRRAINTQIQGSCADLVKMGMIQLHKKWLDTNRWIIAMIHDEIICEVDIDDVDSALEDLRECFESFKLRVPMRLDAHAAANWKEGKG